MMGFEDLFEELASVGQLPWESDDDRADEEESRLKIFANHLFHCLLRNLRAKSDAYAKLEGVDALSAAGRPHLFLVNNAHYMNLAVRGEEGAKGSLVGVTSTVPISVMLSEAFLDRLVSVVEQEVDKFILAVWTPLVTHVKDLGLNLQFQKGSQVLTLDSGRQIKTRLSAFNTGVDEIYLNQKRFSVPDPTLRAKLRADAKETVLPPYTDFYTKFSTVQFSKKHMDQYLRFPPKTVASMIDELYSG